MQGNLVREFERFITPIPLMSGFGIIEQSSGPYDDSDILVAVYGIGAASLRIGLGSSQVTT